MKYNNSKKLLVTALTITLTLSLISANPAFAGVAGQPGNPNDPNFGKCGPMDVTFAVDNTGSMSGAIMNIQTNIGTIIGEVATASAGDYRLGLITFDDMVNVKRNLGAAPGEVEAFIAGGGIGSTGGVSFPEASDEAKNTALNNLPAGLRADSTGFVGSQIGDPAGFTVPWRANAVKILIIFTDALPGGFNDIHDVGFDDVQFTTLPLTAATPGILVSDVFIPTPASQPGMIPLMQLDAANSGGLFLQANADGTGTATAIMEIVNECGGMAIGGEILSISIPSLLIGGIAANAIWIVPIVAGALGTGFYFTRSHWNKSEE